MSPTRGPATLQFLGAAGSVTGSRYLLSAGDQCVLVDCGLFQEPELEAHNTEPLSVAPDQIDAVVLTHAHIDHSGYLPRLVRDGFRGPVWCTPATRALVEIMWRDIAQIAAADASLRGQRGHTRRVEAKPPIYTMGDVERALLLIKTAEYGSTTRLTRGFNFTFRDAGHILGAATVTFEWGAPREHIRLLFSGDLGRPHRPILHDPAPPPVVEYAVVESTYGNRTHPTGDIEGQLASIITETVERGGNVVIPSFAVQRAQEILYHLRRLSDAGRIPSIPVFLDSPMAAAVTAVFPRFAALLDRELAEAFARGDSPFDFPALTITQAPEESRQINDVRRPHIVIAGSGMCDGGRVQHHLLHNAGRPTSTVLFTGFQAPGTLGRRIVEGAPEIELFGETVHVRARIEQIKEFSAHAGSDEIVDWVRSIPNRPRRLFVTHGTPEAAETLRGRLVAAMECDAYTPVFGETVEL
ncbi:MAG: MBL fold metallo-hydrolase [Dehalococcoidia bacterium]|nr:MAG: MBL fold metallo-hydrolase [Dehalococcoidia bacterium]